MCGTSGCQRRVSQQDDDVKTVKPLCSKWWFALLSKGTLTPPTCQLYPIIFTHWQEGCSRGRITRRYSQTHSSAGLINKKIWTKNGYWGYWGYTDFQSQTNISLGQKNNNIEITLRSSSSTDLLCKTKKQNSTLKQELEYSDLHFLNCPCPSSSALANEVRIMNTLHIKSIPLP